MTGRNGAVVQSKRATLGCRWELRPHYFGPKQEWPLRPGELRDTPVTLIKAICREWNMISTENCLISPSGNNWIRELASIIHISKKTMSQQDIEGSLKDLRCSTWHCLFKFHILKTHWVANLTICLSLLPHNGSNRIINLYKSLRQTNRDSWTWTMD